MNKKTALVFLYVLLSVSCITNVPKSSGTFYLAPLSSSSIQSSSISDIFKTHFGHDLDEPYWSIIYDFIGNYTVKDYNPGPYEEYRQQEGDYDNETAIDANFFMGWNKLRDVHSYYLALQNYTWDSSDPQNYGCSPNQYFLQHFKVPATNTHVFALNKFLGLLAYQDNATGIPNLPDENDTLYIGWPQFSELHKYMLNFWFSQAGVLEYYHVDNSSNGTATPIPMNETSPGNFEFGMSYQNIFILWQKLEIEEGLNDTITKTEITNDCIGFSMISSINFTFKISSRIVNGYREVNTTTEYDIGQLDELWIINDTETTAEAFNGTSFDFFGIPIGHYNWTGNGISRRLEGNETTPGFGLAVINTANIAIVKMKSIFFGLIEYPESSEIGNFTDEEGNILGNSTENITQATYNKEGNPLYTIDFASKPTYLLNETSEYDSPSRVLANDLVKTDITGLFDGIAYYSFLVLIGRAIGNDLTGLWTAFEVIDQFLDNTFYYLSCFPEWNGQTITQDPTFTVFVPNPIPKLPNIQEKPSRNWFITIIGGIAIIFLIAIILVLSRKAYIKYIKNRSVSINKGAHRLTIEEVLENENRKQIIDSILEDPGIHFNDLLRETDLAPGNLVWHLDILETYKVIKKKRIGNYVAFIPYYSKNPLSNIDLKLQKSELTLKVLKLIKKNPGIWNSKISENLDVHRKTVQYHIDKLLELELVFRKQDGSRKRIFPNLVHRYFDNYE